MDARYSSFSELDIRIGTIISAKPFKEAIKPAYRLTIDFGPLGVLHSSAQLTACYKPGQLEGLQVVAVVNFKPKQIANMMSECLVLGVLGEGQDVIVLTPERPVENGSKIA